MQNSEKDELRAQWLSFGTVYRTTNVIKPISRSSRPSNILWTLRHSSCSDERDRVYAILGLISFEYQAESIPDYTKSLQQVNKDFFLCMLKFQSTAMFGEISEEPESDSPSWIPKFSQTLSKLPHYSPSGLSKHEVVYKRSDNSLRMPAKAVSTIASIWCHGSKHGVTHDDLESCRAIARQNLADNVYTLGGNMLDAYVCSLAGGRYHEVLVDPWILSLQQLRDLIRVSDHSQEALDDALRSFGHLKGRAIFSTTDGLIGLGPCSAKIGDKIYVTPGVEAAILLANVEGRPNKYRIKGECYVHGLVNSEALLGPLSAVETGSGWSWQWEKFESGHRAVFKCGELKTQDDPRLGPLPEGWKKWYRSDVNGKYYDEEFDSDGTMRLLMFKYPLTKRTTKTDPRLTSTAPKTRGVVFEDIIII